MDQSVTLETGDLVRIELRTHSSVEAFVKETGLAVAIETLSVLIGLIERELVRNRAQIVDPDVLDSGDLCLKVAEHRVVGVADEAGKLAVDARVLKMLGGKMVGTVDH